MKLSNINAIAAFLYANRLLDTDEMYLYTKLDSNMIHIGGVKTPFLTNKICEELNKKYGIIVINYTTEGTVLCIPKT